MGEKPQNQAKKRVYDLLKGRGQQAELARMLGFKSASVSEMLKNPGPIPQHYLEAISKLTGRRIDWILTGEGPEMLMEVEKGGSNAPEPSGKAIPVFDAVVTAGLSLAQEDQTPYSQAYETVNTGTLFREATAAMRVYGDSMFPKYQAGCMIAIKEIFDRDMIVYGEDYVVETSEQRVLKRLMKSEKGDDYIELSSINPQKDDRGKAIYAAKDLQLSKIKRVYKVLGTVRYEIGGDSIVHR